MHGRIIGISGATVRTDLTDLKLYERVRVGNRGLTGEVVKLDAEGAVLQIYEDPHGLAAGEPVRGLGEPLSVTLGPGLLARMFDGLQRPLKEIADDSGPFLHDSSTIAAIDLEREWEVAMTRKVGDTVAAGECIGSIPENFLAHPIRVPAGVSGRVQWVAAGRQALSQPVCILEDGSRILAHHCWPVRLPRPYRRKLAPGEPVITGQRIIDFLFPIARGGTVVIPGGFGAGKTILEQTIAKFADVDVVVYAGCGERGNEMAELIEDFRKLTDRESDRPLSERTVLVVNTSNMPVAARESSIYTAVAMGEYFRDLGYHVLLLADSLSRWAEALREISSSLEEMPGEEGYPTYLTSHLASFAERAGVVETACGATGSLSMILSVSPPGEDFTEPVTQSLLRICGTLLMLDSKLAHSRHFPAINWSHSYSVYEKELLPHFEKTTSAEWPALRKFCRDILRREAELQEIVEIVGMEGLQDKDRLLMLTAERIRNEFLGQNVFSRDAYSAPDQTLRLIGEIADWHHGVAERLGGELALADILAEMAAEAGGTGGGP
ncbi:MAG: V-type ATP synthase subunit A [Thermodesulfobacteriota bacterium]